MMTLRALVRWTGIIYGVMIALVAAAVGAGDAITPAVSSDFFAANPCALPCIYDIQLGTSDRASVTRAIDHPPTAILAPTGAPIVFTTYYIDGTRYIDGAFGFEAHRLELPQVQFAQFYANNGTRLWTLGELLLAARDAGYTPDHIYRTCPGFRRPRLLIGFDGGNTLIAGVPANTERITTHSPVTLLYLSTGENMFLSARQGYFGGCYIETRWYGFTVTERYFQGTAHR